MSNIHFDSTMSEAERRARIYDGDLFVYSPTRASLDLVGFADTMIRAAFASREPRSAQHEMPVGEYAALLAELKPQFIHHPECKRLLPAVLAGLGCDLAQTFFDVPRLRTATSDEYLTTGIAYAFHPHRDTWYSAPFCQINWWTPVYPITPSSSMAFHPTYWARSVRNTSDRYNYQQWNVTSRHNAATQIGVDTREQPKSLEPIDLTHDLRLVVPPGAVIIFSAAQLHSTVPNTTGSTRFSIDFRTVDVDDVRNLRGAANVDSRCSGSTMDDYLNGVDLSHLPTDITTPYDNGPPQAIA